MLPPAKGVSLDLNGRLTYNGRSTRLTPRCAEVARLLIQNPGITARQISKRMGCKTLSAPHRCFDKIKGQIADMGLAITAADVGAGYQFSTSRHVVAEVDQDARDRVIILEDVLGQYVFFSPELKLTLAQRNLLAVIYKRQIATMEQLFTVMPNFGRYKGEYSGEAVSIHIFHLRQKLKPFGIEIHNNPGEGYYLTKQNKETLGKYILTKEQGTITS